MDEGRVIQARKALEENQNQLKQIQFEQDVLLEQNEKYRWLKIIIGAVFVFAVVAAVMVIILLL
jgi:type IV secretory pathway component VirB8